MTHAIRNLTLSLLLVLLAASVHAGETHVELILDASGSMYNQLDDGRYRLTAAKDALGELVLNLPSEGLHVGLRVYGAQLRPDAAGACRDSRLVVPMRGLDREALLAALRDTRARGKTPIGYSLEQAVADFPADAERCMVVLVTDGEEVCGGDLQAAAAKLEAHGCGIDLRIIGFDLTPEAIAGFKGLGRFENAADAAGLATALERAVGEVAKVAPLAAATLEAPEEVTAGTRFEVRWTAEEGPRDYVTIVPPGAEPGTFTFWAYTADGNPVELWAPIEPGDYELRYQSERNPGEIGGRRAIRVIPAEIAIAAPSRVDAGRPFAIEWIGPNGERDYVTIVPADTPDGEWKSFAYTADGSPARLHAPITPGLYELRYQSEREEGVFARRPIEVVPVAITLDAPAELAAGARFPLVWSGPDGDSDYLTIVAADAEDGAYGSYSYTSAGSPTELVAPLEAGDYEIRYQSERERGVFARLALTVLELQASVEAADAVAAGASFEVRWSGPNGPGDYITIVAAGAPAGAYLSYAYTANGSPVTLTAPQEPGSYEVRYQSESAGDKIYAVRPITVR